MSQSASAMKGFAALNSLRVPRVKSWIWNKPCSSIRPGGFLGWGEKLAKSLHCRGDISLSLCGMLLALHQDEQLSFEAQKLR